MKYNKIAFIGMMGAGKSAVAKKLSEKINQECFELDEIFEKRNNISIKDFFEKFSQKEFRKQESELLKEFSQKDSFVLSCGGGIILKKENRDILYSNEIFTIYLKATSETIYQRIKNDKNRPLLLVENPKEEIEKILKTREEHYSKANLTIKTDNKTIEEIIEEILKEI